MPSLIYDAAVSADGYISGIDGDISAFPSSGPIVDAYLDRLSTYHVALMGTETYRFGLALGVAPGVNPYPNMRSIVLSSSLTLPKKSEVEIHRGDAAELVRGLKISAPGDIYLCGGGRLAGSLLKLGLIDLLRFKHAPCLLGGGVRLFGDHAEPVPLKLLTQTSYADGSLFQEFIPGKT